MNNKEEAEKAWSIKSLSIASPTSYQIALLDLKAALIQAVEREAKERVIDENDENFYLIFTANDIIKLINKTKPL